MTELKPGDYVTQEQMQKDAEHWQKCGPELLEALKRMVSVYPYSPPTSNWIPKVAAHSLAEKAISKAENKS